MQQIKTLSTRAIVEQIDLSMGCQTFVFAEESVQELSCQLYQNVWQQLPNVSLFPLSEILVGTTNHIKLIRLPQVCLNKKQGGHYIKAH